MTMNATSGTAAIDKRLQDLVDDPEVHCHVLWQTGYDDHAPQPYHSVTCYQVGLTTVIVVRYAGNNGWEAYFPASSLVRSDPSCRRLLVDATIKALNQVITAASV